MIKTNSDISRLIEGNNRKFSCSLSFDFLSLRRDRNVRIRAPNAVAGSIPDQITDTGLFSLDRLFIGQAIKNKIFPATDTIYADGLWHPKRDIKKSRIGYIGAKANAAGIVDDSIAVGFSTRLVAAIRFETPPNRLIIDATIQVFDDYGKSLFTYEVHGNNHNVLQILCDVKNAASISMTIKKATPNKRIWLVTFTPSFNRTFLDDDIISVKHELKKSQNKAATIGRAYLQSLDVQLFNGNRQFDFLNTDSKLYGGLKQNIEIAAEISLEGTTFFVPLGLFYTDSFESSEEKATVTIKAVDFLGSIKNDEIPLFLRNNTSASSLFNGFARSIGLENNSIDPALESLFMPLFAVSGKIGSALNELCEVTQSTCTINDTGDGLIVKKVSSLRGQSLYPQRYFTVNDYVKSASNKTGDANPNAIMLEYSLAKYEDNEIIDKNAQKVFLYKNLPVRTFPHTFIGVLPQNRPIGAEQAPSTTYNFAMPADYLRTELSDSFEAQNFEYIIEENRQNKTVTVTVWVFEPRDESEQLTIAPIITSKTHNILLAEENYIVPAKPDNYRLQSVSSDIEVRNYYNLPVEFAVTVSGKSLVDYIVPMNIQKQGLFEFVITQTANGCTIRVWNYLSYEQTLTVQIYGKRIIDSPDKKTIFIKNNDAILAEGEIKKNISLKGLPSDAVASSQAQSIASFYETFYATLSFEPWADVRLQINDCIAYESLRGYGFTEGIIEEASLSYEGCITQKLKILQTNRHNRDCRIFGGAVFFDRPAQNRETEGYV